MPAYMTLFVAQAVAGRRAAHFNSQCQGGESPPGPAQGRIKGGKSPPSRVWRKTSSAIPGRKTAASCRHPQVHAVPPSRLTVLVTEFTRHRRPTDSLPGSVSRITWFRRSRRRPASFVRSSSLRPSPDLRLHHVVLCWNRPRGSSAGRSSPHRDLHGCFADLAAHALNLCPSANTSRGSTESTLVGNGITSCRDMAGRRSVPPSAPTHEQSDGFGASHRVQPLMRSSSTSTRGS